MSAAKNMFKWLLSEAQRHELALRHEGLELDREVRRNLRVHENLKGQLARISLRIQRTELASGNRCATHAGEMAFQFSREENRAELTRINYSLMIHREEYRRLGERGRALDVRCERARKLAEDQQGVWLTLYSSLRDGL